MMRFDGFLGFLAWSHILTHQWQTTPWATGPKFLALTRRLSGKRQARLRRRCLQVPGDFFQKTSRVVFLNPKGLVKGKHHFCWDNLMKCQVTLGVASDLAIQVFMKFSGERVATPKIFVAILVEDVWQRMHIWLEQRFGLASVSSFQPPLLSLVESGSSKRTQTNKKYIKKHGYDFHIQEKRILEEKKYKHMICMICKRLW